MNYGGWFQVANPVGGVRISNIMFNLAEDANVFFQLVLLVRKCEGHTFIPLTEEIQQCRGRRKTEALIAEPNPDQDPGTQKNKKVLKDDVLAPMTQWCLAFGSEGDKMLDGIIAEVRTFTDPIANPFLDGNVETENSSSEARLATGAVGKNDHAACITIRDRAGRETHIHVARYNEWFSAYFPNDKKSRPSRDWCLNQHTQCNYSCFGYEKCRCANAREQYGANDKVQQVSASYRETQTTVQKLFRRGPCI